MWNATLREGDRLWRFIGWSVVGSIVLSAGLALVFGALGRLETWWMDRRARRLASRGRAD